MSTRQKRLLAIGLSVATVIASGQYMERSQARSAAPPVEVAQAGFVPPVVTLRRDGADFPVSAVIHLSSNAAPVPPDRDARRLPDLPADPTGPGGLMPLRLGAPLSASPDDRLSDMTADTRAYGVSGLPCGPTLDLRPVGAADLRLTLSAPCRPGARITLHHDRLSVTERTDPMGLLSLDLPAMTEAAAVIVEFEDGTTATSTLSVPGAAGATRALLMADAESGLHLHAFEDGAGFGDAGHVWAGAPRHDRARGRFFTLGDASLPGARMAEIYAAPATAPAPQFSVEAEVTRANCSREVTAELVTPGQPAAQDISFAVPGCAALGEFLLLKNLPQARTLAAN